MCKNFIVSLFIVRLCLDFFLECGLLLKMILFIFYYFLCNYINCIVKIIFIFYLLLYMVFKLNE